jgi:hypothetical protein
MGAARTGAGGYLLGIVQGCGKRQRVGAGRPSRGLGMGGARA